MKKLILASGIFFLVGTTSVHAQEGRKFNPTEMREKQKARLKEDLKLTDEQAEKVVKIEAEAREQMRSLRDLPQEERMSKIKDVTEMTKARLKAELKDDKLVEKIVQYQAEQMKKRMERRKDGE